ncbi:unnamed protein product [Parnassius apollo]|uniref:(apollo) hypothetical protein n=1 Tax=Parnassius apollo TaxID=110799 RepID=A0A8S3WBX4_PARAO|nr:unnamed protein product [Parnassius apollo]
MKLRLFLLFIKNVISFEVIELDGEFLRHGGKPILRNDIKTKNHEVYFDTDNDRRGLDSDEEIKTLLEEKYKFRNDETSTRYRITHDDREFSESPDEQHLAWVFRSYAVRRIVGGMETSINMYPYNVAISRNGKHWCGGAVIDEQWVLTAGHCLDSFSFCLNTPPGSADYDFSLARLDRPLPIGRNIAVLNLPSRDFAIKEDDILLVSGWGSTDKSGYGHIPDRLRFVPVPIMKLEECQKAYKFYITPRMLCAGYATGGKDACNHDSGGPAVRDGVLLGLVSFGGKQCGDPRSPGVYSRVSEVTEWVEATVTANEAINVPELRPKILKARQSEKELQKFKAQVEDKKNKIKDWLRETLSSPTFLELAKRKLKEAGLKLRRRFRRTYSDNEIMDDRMMDDANLSNQINERILGDGEDNEAEALLRMMAIQEIMADRKDDAVLYGNGNEGGRSTDKSALIAFIT